jgi:hypothetical protein
VQIRRDGHTAAGRRRGCPIPSGENPARPSDRSDAVLRPLAAVAASYGKQLAAPATATAIAGSRRHGHSPSRPPPAMTSPPESLPAAQQPARPAALLNAHAADGAPFLPAQVQSRHLQLPPKPQTEDLQGRRASATTRPPAPGHLRRGSTAALA